MSPEYQQQLKVLASELVSPERFSTLASGLGQLVLELPAFRNGQAGVGQ